MSRVGRKAIVIPSGVKVACNNGTVSVEGAKGKINTSFDPRFKVEIKDNKLSVQTPDEKRTDRALHGAIRTSIMNMIIGVRDGYIKNLEIVGVGFKAQVQGKKISLNLGYSHTIDYPIPDGITVLTPKPNQISVSGVDKSKVGEVAAEIRDFCKPEPYKGKGVRYQNEYVRHKAGKKVA